MDSPDRTSWNAPALLHVDMDAFFASVEQLDNPEWRGRPVIVGGTPDGRGVVSTASYEARRFGISSAMPAATAARLCPKAVWVRPRIERYAAISRKIVDIFTSESPWVEPISIDEAYIDVTPGRYSDEDPVAVARRIASRVSSLGLTCSIGLAISKTVAKIASDLEKPSGLTVVPPGAETSLLAPMPVAKLPGIGAVTAQRLEIAGVRTLGALATLDSATAIHLLGSQATSLVAHAAGIDARTVSASDSRHSVSAEKTFACDIATKQEVEQALRRLAERVASRLRSKGLAGRTVTIKMRYADFTTRTSQRTLAEPTDLDDVLMETATALLTQSWSSGAGLRLLGIGVSGFDRGYSQLTLQSTESSEPRSRSLAKSLDEIKRRFGNNALRYGASNEAAER